MAQCLLTSWMIYRCQATMLSDGQTAQHCNCHLLCRKATSVPAARHWHFAPPCSCSHLLTLTCQKRTTWTRELFKSPWGISSTWKYIQPLAQSSSCALNRHWVRPGIFLWVFTSILFFLKGRRSYMPTEMKTDWPGKMLLFHGPVQIFKCKSMQTLYFSHVPAKSLQI